MKVKAVLMGADRTNTIVTVTKRKLQSNTFRHGDQTYFLHPDRFMVTWTRPNWALGLKKSYYATYYYVQGHANPLPVPDFKAVMVKRSLADKLKSGNGNGAPHVDTSDGFAAIVDNGISSEELAAIFNPWFYRTIAAQSLSIWEQVQLWLLAANLCALIYIVYILSTGSFVLPESIPAGG